MKQMITKSMVIILFVLSTGCKSKSQVSDNPQNHDTLQTDIHAWISDPVNGNLFQQYNKPLNFESVAGQDPIISVDSSVTYQTIDGFGNCLTGGSASVIRSLDQGTRTNLLKELFGTDSYNIGISYLRLSIGASDLSDHPFTYDDMPVGETDTSMTHFTLDQEKTDLIPLLKEILAINPSIMIMGSPWSAPAWMKTNASLKDGSLKPEYFDAYAKYFVRYIKGMALEGINVYAITIQNEPLNPANNPSMFMSAADQASFIKQSLGPAFRKEGITTKIIVYDHNADHPEYPLSIYEDNEAAQYVDGAAFHLYAGSINALSDVHNSYPSKNLYFTEQWVGAPGNMTGDLAWHIRNVIIGSTRNWCRTALEWNMASDASYQPHTDGGCTSCLGAVTIFGSFITRNPSYYVLAHSAKLVRPGSVRIFSSLPDKLPNVAFQTPEGLKVLIVLNDYSSLKSFTLQFNGKTARLSLPASSVGTFYWQ